MFNVFISYSHDDSDFAELLHAKLRLQGLITYLDHQGLRPGDEWREELDQAILGSQLMIVILSRSSARSPYVCYEWALALGARIRIIPIVLENDEWHPQLAALQHLDFSHKQRPWEQLYTTIQAFAPRDTITVAADAAPVIVKATAALDSIRENEQINAVEALTASSDPLAHRVLEAALRHPSRTVRVHAARRLIALDRHRGNVDVAAVLLRERCFEMEDLGGVGETTWYFELAMRTVGPAAIPMLLSVLQGDERELRNVALRALALVADTEAIDATLDAFLAETKATEPAWRALECLRIGCNAASTPVWLECLEHEHRHYRELAARALGDLRAVTSAQRMALVLAQEPNSDVRRAISNALGKLGGEAAIAALLDRLLDSSEKNHVRKAALQALIALETPSALAAMRQIFAETLSHQEVSAENWRLGALEGLVRLRDTDSTQPLVGTIKALEREHYDYVKNAVKAFALWREQAIPALEALMDEGGWHSPVGLGSLHSLVGNAAAEALRLINTPTALQLARRWERHHD